MASGGLPSKRSWSKCAKEENEREDDEGSHFDGFSPLVHHFKRPKVSAICWPQEVPGNSSKGASFATKPPPMLKESEATMKAQFEMTVATVSFPYDSVELTEKDKKLVESVDMKFLVVLAENHPEGFVPKVFQKTLITTFPEKIGMGYGWRYDKNFYITDSVPNRLRTTFTSSILEVWFNPGGGCCGKASDRAYGVARSYCYCDRCKMENEAEEDGKLAKRRSLSLLAEVALSESSNRQTFKPEIEAWPRFIIWIARGENSTG